MEGGGRGAPAGEASLAAVDGGPAAAAAAPSAAATNWNVERQKLTWRDSGVEFYLVCRRMPGPAALVRARRTTRLRLAGRGRDQLPPTVSGPRSERRGALGAPRPWARRRAKATGRPLPLGRSEARFGPWRDSAAQRPGRGSRNLPAPGRPALRGASRAWNCARPRAGRGGEARAASMHVSCGPTTHGRNRRLRALAKARRDTAKAPVARAGKGAATVERGGRAGGCVWGCVCVQDEDRDPGAEVAEGSAIRFFVNGVDCGEAFTGLQAAPPPPCHFRLACGLRRPSFRAWT